MRKSIIALSLASMGALVAVATVAAANPFASVSSGTSASHNDTYRYAASAPRLSATSPLHVANHVTSAPAAAPVATPRPSATQAPVRHHAETRISTQTRTTQRQMSTYQDRHGSDWCDDYGRDDHGSDWH